MSALHKYTDNQLFLAYDGGLADYAFADRYPEKNGGLLVEIQRWELALSSLSPKGDQE